MWYNGLEKMLRRISQWHTSLMTIASPAAHAQQNAPLRLSLRATANTLSTLMLASNAALAQTLALLKLPRLNN